MLKNLKIFQQYLAPQHALSQFAGWMSEIRSPWLKNRLIHWFIKRYQVDMKDFVIEDPNLYENFNNFFIRKLKPELRPIAAAANQIASPVDGCVSQMGAIKDDLIFQAKKFYYSLNTLLGGSETLTKLFRNGSFATLYLAPRDYHRVHMPFDGILKQTIYIPGKLFSVNYATTQAVPQLFARNERLVCLFETAIGPMIVILVGAMLVGSINTVWSHSHDFKKLSVQTYSNNISLKKGEELGYFKMGSTVILLFPQNCVSWIESLKENARVQMGESIGTV